MFCFGTTYRSLKSMDTAKYFQKGLSELVEIWRTEQKFYTPSSEEILNCSSTLQNALEYND
jgi:hypothetical protein